MENKQTDLMNEYAKQIWLSKHGTRRECGVNGKWYHYAIDIGYWMLMILLIMMLWISIVGWFFIDKVPIDFIRDYYQKHHIYLIKYDAIEHALREIEKQAQHPFTLVDTYVVSLDLPDSQWFGLAKDAYWLRLDSDFSMSAAEIKALKQWLKQYDIPHLINNRQRLMHRVSKSHYRSQKNGLYLTLTTVAPEFFQTEYGQKLAQNYRVYYHNGELPENKYTADLSRIASTAQLINYGSTGIGLNLNWTGKPNTY